MTRVQSTVEKGTKGANQGDRERRGVRFPGQRRLGFGLAVCRCFWQRSEAPSGWWPQSSLGVTGPCPSTPPWSKGSVRASVRSLPNLGVSTCQVDPPLPASPSLSSGLGAQEVRHSRHPWAWSRREKASLVCSKAPKGNSLGRGLSQGAGSYWPCSRSLLLGVVLVAPGGTGCGCSSQHPLHRSETKPWSIG